MAKCKLHILVGLPGSGKSFWAEEFKKNNRSAFIVDFDRIEKYHKKDHEQIYQTLKEWYPAYETIIDGLFLTEKDVIAIMNDYLSIFSGKYDFQEITIHYWEPNVQACLINDMFRRRVSASATIKNFKLQKPSLITLMEECAVHGIPINLVSHQTVSKSIGRIWAECNGAYPETNGDLHSSSWTLWCTHRSLDGSNYAGSAEEPENFDELDKLLEEACPNITFLQYKRIITPLIEQLSRDIVDYYTSGEEGYWSINCDKLYNALLENGIIKEFELT